MYLTHVYVSSLFLGRCIVYVMSVCQTVCHKSLHAQKKSSTFCMLAYYHNIMTICTTICQFDRTIVEGVISLFWRSYFPFWHRICYRQICTRNFSSILNRKSSKFYMLAYYNMEIRISLWLFEGVIAIFELEYFIKHFVRATTPTY
jgi:hypothetical protein